MLRRTFAAAVIAAALALGAPAAAVATPIEVYGDNGPNTIALTMTTNGTIEICTDGFCGEEGAAFFDSIVVHGFDGDDLLQIDHDAFLTNGRGGIDVMLNGGPGDDRVELCADGCAGSQVEATAYAPGSGTGDGRLTQTSGTETLQVALDSVVSVTDLSPGDVTVHGTAGDDVMTYGAGSDASRGRVTTGLLVPYEFSSKRTLTIDGAAGADRVEVDGPGTPDGLTGGDCGDGHPVCILGGSSTGDRLVVHGVAGQQDQASLAPLARSPFDEEIGVVDGIAGTASLSFAAIDAVDLVLQYGADGDRFQVAGGAGNDRFEIARPGAAQVTVLPVLDASAPGAPSLPPVTVSAANESDIAQLRVAAGAGDDELTVLGGARYDGLSLAPAGSGTDQLRHAVDGRLAYVLAAEGVERYAGDGGDGGDAMRVRGDLAAAVGWAGGNGSDTVALDGTGSSPVAVSLADGSVRQEGFGVVQATGTETFDAGAGGSSVALTSGAAGDTLRYTPSAADAGTVVRDADGRTVHVRQVAGLLRLDPLGGADLVVVRGSAAADQVPMTRDAGSDTLTVQVGATLPVRLAASTEAARVEGADGEDRFIVAGGGGGPAAVTVDGGADPGADTLVTTLGVRDAAVTYATDPASGVVETAAPPIGFTALETIEIEGDGTGTLAVNGSSGADPLTQTGNRVAAGGGAVVTFARFPALALDARAGADQLTLNPRGTSGVQEISVAGGESGADALAVNGTELGEEIRYAPTAADGGRVEVAGGPPVAFTATESLAVDGRTTVPSGDALVVDTRALDGTHVLEPGPAFDAGTVRFRDAAGSATTAVPVNFGRLGSGSLQFDDAARNDTLHYRGAPAADVFSLAGDGSVRLNAQLPVSTPGIHTLVLQALDGDDTFNLPAEHPFPGADGHGVVLEGGNPDAGDVVNLRGAGAGITADLARSTVRADGFAPIALVGIGRLELDGASQLAVAGGGGPDVLRYTPTGAQAGTVTADGAAPELRFTGVAGTVTADAGAGSDQIVVAARSADDETLIARGDPTVVGVGDLKAVHVPAATESLQVLGRDGADTTTITGAGGPGDLAVHGGLPTGDGDRLLLRSSTAAVTYDTVPSNGRIASSGGAVGFAEMERLDLEGDSLGSVTVNGTNGADSVSVGNEATPQVRVNGGATVEYRGYPTMVLDGRGGDDVLDVSYLTLGDVAAIQANGGAGLGDRLVVQDQPGSPRTLAVRPTAPDAGTFSLGAPPAVLTFASTESLLVDGMGGGDELRLVTPSGAQAVHVVPGATDDAATLQLDELVPVAFQRLGAGRLRVVDADGARADRVVYDGGPGADAFAVIGEPNAVTLNSRVPLLPDAARHLVLNGLDGDDAFDVTGPLPFATTRTDGSGPDRADTLSVIGPAGPVTADLGTGTLVGYGGTLSYPGIEQLATDVGGSELTQVGRPADDALCYDPMSPRSGRAYVAGAPGAGSVATTCAPDQRGTNLLHTFTDVARLTLDPAGGSDQVIVNGTTNADLATLKLTHPHATVTLHPDASDPLAFRLPAEVVVDTTESLAFAADNGADLFDVTVFDNPAPVVFLDGEDPAPKRFGDELHVRDGTGRAHYQNVTAHEFGAGTVFAEYRYSFTQRIDYTGIENVTTYRDPKLG